MIRRGLLRELGKACAAIACCASLAAGETALSIENAGKRSYQLNGRFTVQASSLVVWEVLTDYDRISGFVSSLRLSEVVERRSSVIFLKQEAQGSFFFFSRRVHVLLALREEPGRKITFTDVSGEDFEYYAGSWEIREVSEGVEVAYRLAAKRAFLAPNFVAKGVMKKNIAGLLREVKEEILRRQEILDRNLARMTVVAE